MMKPKIVLAEGTESFLPIAMNLWRRVVAQLVSLNLPARTMTMKTDEFSIVITARNIGGVVTGSLLIQSNGGGTLFYRNGTPYFGAAPYGSTCFYKYRSGFEYVVYSGTADRNAKAVELTYPSAKVSYERVKMLRERKTWPRRGGRTGRRPFIFVSRARRQLRTYDLNSYSSRRSEHTTLGRSEPRKRPAGLLHLPDSAGCRCL